MGPVEVLPVAGLGDGGVEIGEIREEIGDAFGSGDGREDGGGVEGEHGGDGTGGGAVDGVVKNAVEVGYLREDAGEGFPFQERGGGEVEHFGRA